jgi:hypothetical protein
MLKERLRLAMEALTTRRVQTPLSTYIAPDGYVTLLEHRMNFPISPGGRRIMSMVQESSERYNRHLANISQLNKWLDTIPLEAKDNKAPFWNNEFIPTFDAIALALMLLETKAKTVIEIGSGNSTKFLRSAIEFFKMDTMIVSIDPYPRAEVEELCDQTIRKSLENATEEVLEIFPKRPLVFFDGSHRVLPNSDVMVFFWNCYPRYRAAVSMVSMTSIYLMITLRRWPSVYIPSNTCWPRTSWAAETAIRLNCPRAI